MVAIFALLLMSQSAPPNPFAIKVVDDSTGRGVPLVELRTVNGIRFVTDSAGNVAFDEPGLLGEDVHFTVRSFGYSFPKDGFGIAGKTLKTSPAGSVVIKVHRDQIAERLYRNTGGGIYRDSLILGKPAPVKLPVLNAKVLGQDSIQSMIFGGKILWFWGDTNRPSYPLGNFHMPGASSDLPANGGLDPELGINLDYRLDAEGFARPTAKMPGDGPTWLGGMTVLRDENGRERLYACYDKIRNFLETYQRGIVEWDADDAEFRKRFEFPLDAPLYPQGHPLFHKVEGQEYVYFPVPFPVVRVRANVHSFLDLAQYEAFTPLATGSRLKDPKIDRDRDGRVVYGWKKNTPPVSPSDVKSLIAKGLLKGEESLFLIRDSEAGRTILAHGGSVNWNAYRQRWVMIFVETGGVSPLGEVYFAEADSPLGPWAYARKIATHADSGLVYSFYNPKHHAFLDKEGGRTIFFEGTYTATFSGNNDPTPRYDYNQIMYKLDLASDALALPVAIYRDSDGSLLGSVGESHRERVGNSIAFFAPDRPNPSCKAIFLDSDKAGAALQANTVGQGSPAFYVIPPDVKSPPKSTVPLIECVRDGNRFWYGIEGQPVPEGFRRTERALGYVWPNPSSITVPRE